MNSEQDLKESALLHLRHLHRVRSLTVALLRYATPESCANAANFLTPGLRQVSEELGHFIQPDLITHYGPLSVSVALHTLAKDVFQHIIGAWPPLTASAGWQLLRQAQTAIYPSSQYSSADLSDLVRDASIVQAEAMGEVLEWVLAVVCDESNCLQLLPLAKLQGWSAVEQRCMELALGKFAGAAQPGFLQLPFSCLLSILSRSDLQVEAELHVWLAAAAWIDHNVSKRQPSVLQLLERGVRLAQMSKPELEIVMCHPAVDGSKPAHMLVAAVYCQVSGYDTCLSHALYPGVLRMAAVQPRSREPADDTHSPARRPHEFSGLLLEKSRRLVAASQSAACVTPLTRRTASLNGNCEMPRHPGLLAGAGMRSMTMETQSPEAASDASACTTTSTPVAATPTSVLTEWSTPTGPVAGLKHSRSWDAEEVSKRMRM